MAIDKERHDKGERDFLYIVGAKLNESRRKKKLKQHDVVSMLEEKYQYKTSAQHISDLASDAIDKLYYKSLTDTSVGMNKGDFRIRITRDKENRLLTISDNGIGMTKDELEKLADKLEKEFREICDLLR